MATGGDLRARSGKPCRSSTGPRSRNAWAAARSGSARNASASASARSHRPSAAFHFTWQPDEAAVRAVLREVEAALSPWRPRPHWGKLFELADPGERYANWARFAELRDRLDPDRTFRNALVDGWFTG